MESIKKIDVGEWDTILNIPPKHWSIHAFDQSCKSEHTINNMTESFKLRIGDNKKLTIIHTCEFI